MNGVADDTPRALSRTRSAVVLCLGMIAAALLLPFDGAISRFVTGFRPGGDVRRELEVVQQFGGLTTIALVSLLIWRLDPSRLRRVVNWLVAAGLTWAAVFTLKSLLGRPRPKFAGEHLAFLGPWNARVVKEGEPARHAWEFWQHEVTEIWSMPSSHTAFAVVAAVMLSRMYPRLRPVVWTLAVVVGVCRVLFRAHYPSDVLVGAAIGYVIAGMCVGPVARLEPPPLRS